MWLGIFCILLKYFSNKSYLMAHRDKSIMLYILNFKKGSSHVYSFIWIFNAPNVENEAACIEFIDKTINSQLPDYLNDSEFFELVKTYQVHVHSRASWKYIISSPVVDILLRRQLLRNYLVLSLAMI